MVGDGEYPRFATGEGPWRSSSTRRDGSDSATERDFQSSDPSAFPPSNGAQNATADENVMGTPVLPHWSAKRHMTCGNPSPPPPYAKLLPWRATAPGKLKTANAALVICLNIDVDPPDVVKTNPCAVLEAWVDPHTMPSHKALEAIGSNLQHQFEGLSNKMVYKPILDPCFEDLSRFCRALRKSAKDDAVLFYYNGHGVPKPTASGELWCFNKTYTQYIPVSLSEVQTWLGAPGVFIWDCSGAGNLLTNFNTFAERRDQEAKLHAQSHPHTILPPPYMSSIQLASCLAHEVLPSIPELPADIFTACLTSPIDMALRFFILRHQLPINTTADMVMQLPGDLKDRRTPLGELNWIFTAITDTIAWTTFDRETFSRLYRCDLLIASLFRNFLLAERVLKNYHCTPHTYPPLPPTNTHPMWDSWDLAVDSVIRQLPQLLGKDDEHKGIIHLDAAPITPVSVARPGRIGQPQPNGAPPPKPYNHVPGRFFTDQLQAFEIWISRGGSALTRRGPLALSLTPSSPAGSRGPSPTMQHESEAELAHPHHQYHHIVWSSPHLVPRKPPPQLPIVLQVLLSQPHRLRALILLSQFVDLGPWAVHLVLSIGIFPYISKLLGAAGSDLRPVLIFIWARIVAVDPSVQVDLVTTGGFGYFARVLGLRDDDAELAASVPTNVGPRGVGGKDQPQQLPNPSEHKAMCAFILATVARSFPQGQAACWSEPVFDFCYERLEASDFLLRQWAALCIGQLWADAEAGVDRGSGSDHEAAAKNKGYEGGHTSDDYKVYGVDRGAQDVLIGLLSDPSPEVRSAALYALGTFMGANGGPAPANAKFATGAPCESGGGGGTGTMPQLDERIHFRMEVAVATGATLAIKDDASPMCRKELVVLLSCLVKEWRGYFVVCAWFYMEEDRRWNRSASLGTIPGYSFQPLNQFEDDRTSPSAALAAWLSSFGPEDDMLREENRVLLSSMFTIYVALLDLSTDAYTEVAVLARTVVDYIHALLFESPFKYLTSNPSAPKDSFAASGSGENQFSASASRPRSRVPSLQPNGAGPVFGHNPAPPSPNLGVGGRPGIQRSDTMASTMTQSTAMSVSDTISAGVSSTIRRTSSFANALKSLAGGIAFPTTEERDGIQPHQLQLPTPLYSYGASRERDVADVSRPPSPNLNFAQYASPYPSRPQGSRPGAGLQRSTSYASSMASTATAMSDYHPPADYLPCDVMEALFEEDMERLRARRRGGHRRKGQSHTGRHNGAYPQTDGLNSPCSSTFSMESTNSSVILGLGTGVGIRDVLPLKSSFFDWCCEYFTEPQMRQTEADEPGSVQYNYQVWRQQRNEQVIEETSGQVEAAETSRWDRSVATLQNQGVPLSMAFHAFDKHLVVANEADMVSVWDWSTKKRLNHFCNGNPRGTNITSLHIINQDVGGIILTSSSDAVIRLYRNYDPAVDTGPVQMVSSFRGLNEVIPMRQGSGVVTDWTQSGGNLLVGGDSRIIRSWDAHNEAQAAVCRIIVYLSKLI
ncbi:hypothetical protein HGRIS_008588 [Hohenbuehelia grisea]|uniref:Raptor N-terminal CASPase-like domain-containing protein n=1 Tax=Hohenbuehelia grisea TaxID=104357 RepID=A0ABR3J8Q9_9AGAR